MLKKMLLVGAMFSLLAGCGGGGAGVADPAANLPAAYTGNKAPATVTTANAKALSVDVYNFSQDAASLNVLGKAVAGNGAQSSLLLQAVRILDETVSKAGAVSKSESKVVALTVTSPPIYGYSGSYSYSISVDTNSGSTSGTLYFTQYKADSSSVAINGTVTFSGVFNQTTGVFSSFSMSMTSMAVTDGTANITLSGKLTASINGSTKTTTMTLAVTDSNSTIVLKDYTLQLYNNSSLTVTGTYFDPVNGYVVISTLTPLIVSDLSATPTAGVLLFTGSNGTKARLTFTTGGYIVYADTVGNGTFILVP